MDIILEEQRKESNVGKMLTDYTLRKVILIVLLMLFTNPLFMVQTYVSEPNSFNYGLDLLAKAQATSKTALSTKFFDDYIEMYQRIEETPLIFLCVNIKG